MFGKVGVFQGHDANPSSNTAQVFTSLAEFWIDFGRQSPDLQAQTITYLTSAIDLFQKCLNLQQQQYDSFAGFGEEPPSADARPPPKAPQDDTMDMDSGSEDEDTGGVSLSGHHEAPNQSPVPASSSEVQSETALSEYAHVIEPVTLSTLLDTTLALLHAYTLIFPLIPTASDLSTANDAVEKLLKDRLEPLSNSLPEREPEIALDLALLRCAQSEAQWRSSFASLADWSQTIAAAPWPSPPSTSSLTAKADAHIALAEAALESQPPDALMSWKQFSFASAAFGEATKLEPTKAELYLARGDAEMMRSRIDGVEAAVKSRAVLRKNAGVYYRGAMKLGEGRVKLEGDTKDRMIKYEDGDQSAFTGLDERTAREVVEDAVAEGVFGAEWLDRVRETEVAMDE